MNQSFIDSWKSEVGNLIDSFIFVSFFLSIANIAKIGFMKIPFLRDGWKG